MHCLQNFSRLFFDTVDCIWDGQSTGSSLQSTSLRSVAWRSFTQSASSGSGNNSRLTINGQSTVSASVDSLAGSRLCEIWATYWIEFGPNKSTSLWVSRLVLHQLLQSVEASVSWNWDFGLCSWSVDWRFLVSQLIHCKFLHWSIQSAGPCDFLVSRLALKHSRLLFSRNVQTGLLFTS